MVQYDQEDFEINYPAFASLVDRYKDPVYIGDNEYVIFLLNGNRVIFNVITYDAILIERIYDKIPIEVFKKEFGRKLKRKIKISRVRVEEVCAYCGFSRTSFYDYANGKYLPDMYTIYKLCKFFNCSYESLTNFWYLEN